MLTQDELDTARNRAAAALADTGVVLTAAERATIEVADFGLSRLDEIGLQLVVYVNTERVCAKELVLFPRQTCPEHRHPPVGDRPARKRPFVAAAASSTSTSRAHPRRIPRAARLRPVPTRSASGTRSSFVLVEQHTIPPNVLHWFQAGDEGAVVSEFSTMSTDELDVFTDVRIGRATVIGEE